MMEVRTVQLEKMTEYYELIEVPYAIESESKPDRSEDSSNPTSPKYSRLIVVDKEKWRN